mmetsp:Transcript_66834/g.196190  ORF Transcript_66834/g.196190 Transcript_66834/m.196190 type:complete len:232 (-) Transcript_66834:152-847(-)
MPSPEMDFGKYRGKPMEEVRKTDLDYSRWVYSMHLLGKGGSFGAFAEWMEQKRVVPSLGKDDDLIDFGKNKGRTFGELVQEDPGYCEWALEKAQSEAVGGSLLDFAAFYAGYLRGGGKKEKGKARKPLAVADLGDDEASRAIATPSRRGGELGDKRATKVVQTDKKERKVAKAADGSSSVTCTENRRRKVLDAKTGAELETRQVSRKKSVQEKGGRTVETETITIKRVKRR